MAEHIKLHGGRAERFRKLKQQIEEDIGYEPTNAEAVGHIMAEWPDEDYPLPSCE
jgi:hypothetical protein